MEILQSKGADDISVIGLAKREEEVFVPHQSQPIILPRNSYALKVLQRIRDEAHRFAITFHRSLRQKRQTHSKLLVIDGVVSTTLLSCPLPPSMTSKSGRVAKLSSSPFASSSIRLVKAIWKSRCR